MPYQTSEDDNQLSDQVETGSHYLNNDRDVRSNVDPEAAPAKRERSVSMAIGAAVCIVVALSIALPLGLILSSRGKNEETTDAGSTAFCQFNSSSLYTAVRDLPLYQARCGPIQDWDVSRVTNMERLFGGLADFNEAIQNWDTSNVRIMEKTFASTKSFNQPLNQWNTSRVVTMYDMFYDAQSFNHPLDQWDTSSVTNMRGMFFRNQVSKPNAQRPCRASYFTTVANAAGYD